MAIWFDTDIQFLKGVGPKLSEVFAKRGVYTAGDLLELYPRTYEDRRAARSISSLEDGQIVSLVAQVHSVRSMNLGKSRRKMYEVMVGDRTGRISCKYFRVPYRGYFERFQPFEDVRISGKVTLYRGRLEFHHPDIHPIKKEESQESEEVEDVLLPLYSELDGVRPAKLRKIIGGAIHHLIDHPEVPQFFRSKEEERRFQKGVPEYLPQWILDEYKLLRRSTALKKMHQPPAEEASAFVDLKSDAHRRIIFEEFFWLELHLAMKRMGVKKQSAPAFKDTPDLVERFLKSLPFELTGAQKKSFSEIKKDLMLPHPMHRLVQGDVGSGKTMVAMLSAVMCTGNGMQSALMVPTEILAEQHYKNAVKILEPMGIRVGLITGQLKAKEHAKICEKLKAGEIDLCIGTHALIQNAVEFNKLGLVIIDEQHRFGVDQRIKLKKDTNPHFLVMTATPIPRTLAMTVYGDLDVSIINELPPGRSPIVTRKVFNNKRPKVLQFMQDQIAKGRQVYFVYPLVEESDKIDLKNAVEEFEKLKKQFPQYQVGLLHGKMKPAEKESVMNDFRAGKYQILVSTTVIEVGVDVPNANLMIIEHAERFGLSQLHQLRGRVGRGQHKSFCVLILGHAVSEDSVKRAEVMEKYTDGFKIAEEDLQLRGPGEFMGTRQSGLSGFRIANLVRDLEVLKQAREAAFSLIHKDPQLKFEQHFYLKEALEKRQKNVVG